MSWLIKITVFAIMFSDKPGAPEGPLVVDEVFADSCRLSWKPPVDDGNAPVSGRFTRLKISNVIWSSFLMQFYQ